MRHWTQVLVLGMAAVLCLGTSKSLSSKKLVSPQVQAAGLAVIGKPKAALKENVNNQGCFAKQRIDFVLTVDLRAGAGSALQIPSDGIQVTVGFDKGEQSFRVGTARFLVGHGKHLKQQGDGTTLAPGTRGTLQLQAASILPKKRLQEIRWIRLAADFSSSRLVLTFRDVDKVRVQMN